MKKFYLSALVLILSGALVACGDTNEKEESNSPSSTKSETDSTNKENKTSDNEDTKKDVKTTEEVEESDLGKMTIVYKNKELNESAESGPMKLLVNAVQLGNLEVSEDYKEMFDNKEMVTVVTVQIKAENTSDETISFYPDQATLTTDAGDQQDADMILSDSVGGEFFGKVNKEGNIIFLVNTPAENIGEINLIVSASSDENFENQGEDIKITIPTK